MGPNMEEDERRVNWVKKCVLEGGKRKKKMVGGVNMNGSLVYAKKGTLELCINCV